MRYTCFSIHHEVVEDCAIETKWRMLTDNQDNFDTDAIVMEEQKQVNMNTYCLNHLLRIILWLHCLR